MTKPVSSRFQRSVFWAKSHKLLSLFLFIVLLVAGIFVYERAALELNKRAFARARTAIDTVYADIVAQVGPPDNSKRISSCTLHTEEFSTGPIYCDVDTRFIYGVLDENTANIEFQKIQRVMGKYQTFKSIKPLDISIHSAAVVNTSYKSASDTYKVAGLDCVVNYVFDTPSQIDLEIRDKNKRPLEITIGCHSLARSKYYPTIN